MPPAYGELYYRTEGRPMPLVVLQGESNADVLRPGRGFIGAFDYTMQLQVGCPGGCLFCYVPASKRLTPADISENWGFEVRTKRHAVEKFRRHLRSGKLAGKTLYWSGVTDPYAAPPWMTRAIWRNLIESPKQLRPKRIAVQSRFPVRRDARLIAEYRQSTRPFDGGPPVVVSYSIGTDRNDVIRSWERATPSFEQRMKTVQTLCQAGIFAVVTLSPFGPWNDLIGALRKLRSMGVRYLTVLFFKVKDSCASTPSGFLQYLRAEWQLLLDPAWQADRLSEIREVYGADRVLLEQPGFSSLVEPHLVGCTAAKSPNLQAAT